MIWALWVSDPYIPPFDPCHSLPLPPLPHPNLHLDRYGGHDARSPEACRLGGWWQPGEAGTPAPQDDLGGAAAAPHGQGSGPLPAPRRFIFPRFIFIFLCLFVCLFFWLTSVCCAIPLPGAYSNLGLLPHGAGGDQVLLPRGRLRTLEGQLARCGDQAGRGPDPVAALRARRASRRAKLTKWSCWYYE